MEGAPVPGWRGWARVAAGILAVAAVIALILAVRDPGARDPGDDVAAGRCMDDVVGALRIKVFVVAEPIAAGTPGAEAIDADAFEVRQLSTEHVPTGFVNELRQIEGGAAVADLEEDQVLTASMFGVGGEASPPASGSCG